MRSLTVFARDKTGVLEGAVHLIERGSEMSQDRRPIDRYLDRLERILERSEAAERAARKEKRAQKEKLQPPDEGRSRPSTEESDSKH